MIVTDYRLNANHNKHLMYLSMIVTDYRLNANHNW
ncbi:Helicase loader DnaI, partial [uncultured Gammaproteobacteria bacterium]